jgi:hypothetical protein
VIKELRLRLRSSGAKERKDENGEDGAAEQVWRIRVRRTVEEGKWWSESDIKDFKDRMFFPLSASRS